MCYVYVMCIICYVYHVLQFTLRYSTMICCYLLNIMLRVVVFLENFTGLTKLSYRNTFSEVVIQPVQLWKFGGKI